MCRKQIEGMKAVIVFQKGFVEVFMMHYHTYWPRASHVHFYERVIMDTIDFRLSSNCVLMYGDTSSFIHR